VKGVGQDTRNRVSGLERVVSYTHLEKGVSGTQGVVSVSYKNPRRGVGVSPCVGDSQITAYSRTREQR